MLNKRQQSTLKLNADAAAASDYNDAPVCACYYLFLSSENKNKIK